MAPRTRAGTGPVRAHIAMVLVQFAYGGYHVLTKRALLKGATSLTPARARARASSVAARSAPRVCFASAASGSVTQACADFQPGVTGGVNMYVFCAARDLIALVCLAVTHAVLETSGCGTGLGWRSSGCGAASSKSALPLPPPRLLPYCAALGLTGVFANQLLFLKGLELTSPVVAAALQPAVPVFTGVLAVALGSERISFRRRDGWAKIAGAALVVAGALVTALRSAPLPLPHGLVSLEGAVGAIDAAVAAARRLWVGLGCLFGNCASMAVFLTLQESLLAKYAAPMRITLISYAFGAALLVLALLLGAGAQEARSSAYRWTLPPHARGAVLYAGVVASGINYVLLAWGNQQLGPAMVSLYLPLQPLAAALLSHGALGTPVGGAVLEGGVLIALGLICVAWGRGANRRYEERQQEKLSYLARVEAAGGGETGRQIVRSTSAKLLSERDVESM